MVFKKVFDNPGTLMKEYIFWLKESFKKITRRFGTPAKRGTTKVNSLFVISNIFTLRQIEGLKIAVL
jgi:hypothetical protein